MNNEEREQIKELFQSVYEMIRPLQKIQTYKSEKDKLELLEKLNTSIIDYIGKLIKYNKSQFIFRGDNNE